LRVAVFGGVALVLFAVVFFRLWYLQVLSGDEYVSQANDNRVREVRIQAPRGDIVDRSGQTLVTNRQATVIQVIPGEMPDEGPRRDAFYGRLGEVLRMKPQRIERIVTEQQALLPYANVTIKTDAPRTVLNYLQERKRAFPGIDVTDVYLRRYPRDTLAAQLIGTVGEISPEELEDKRYRDVKQGTIIGKDGIEWQYDRYLRGQDGAQLLQVDSMGGYKGELRRRQPVPGQQLKLSLDLRLQRAAQEAIATAGGGLPGAFVAMDPRNGEILALGSYPSFDPSVFTKPISQDEYEALSSEETGAPLFNRAIAGLYPTGSTFKPITALAALTSGVITTTETINDTGCLTVGSTDFCSPGNAGAGVVALASALRVSSDVYFYVLGRDLDPLDGEPLQKMAERLGLGRPTGVDLPGEQGGLVPDREWRAEVGEEERKCRKREKVDACGISDMRPWSTGDNVNLSIGQGDLQATPLQMAVAYATILNDGRVVRPHLGLDIEDSQGRLVQEIEPPPTRTIDIPDDARAAIMDGLHQAASTPGGTSADVFAGWPQDRFPVYGKTGTAERGGGRPDQSWYVCFVDDPTRPIVVATTVEGGGWGASSAAPAARQILSQWYLGRQGEFIRGESHTQ
ncbi:MAG TPA: penicillin-binding protein 2, partial [Capillimicrobium sp.]